MDRRGVNCAGFYQNKQAHCGGRCPLLLQLAIFPVKQAPHCDVEQREEKEEEEETIFISFSTAAIDICYQQLHSSYRPVRQCSNFSKVSQKMFPSTSRQRIFKRIADLTQSRWMGGNPEQPVGHNRHCH